MDQPWNANIHYDALLDAMVPLGTQCVLDVGCGDGLLAARLARRIPYVTAVDIDAPVLRRAQTRFANAPIRWLHADIMTAELPNAGFDAATQPRSRPAARGVYPSAAVRPGARYVARTRLIGRTQWRRPI